MADVRIPERLDAAVADELIETEEVRWQGAPSPRLRLRWYDAILVPMSLAYLVLSAVASVVIVASAIDPTTGGDHARQPDPAGAVFTVVLLLALLGGLAYLAFGRFIARSYARRRTRYVVTDRRLLTVHVGRHRRVNALRLDAVVGIRTHVRRDGSGSVVFGDQGRGSPSRGALTDLGPGLGGPATTHAASVAFRDVDEVDALLGRLRELGVGC